MGHENPEMSDIYIMLRHFPGFFLLLLLIHLSPGCKSSAKNQSSSEVNQTAYMGILYTKSEKGGVMVMEVFQDSPAEKAELNVGDIILSVDDRAVAGVMTMKEQIQSLKPGTVVTLSVIKKFDVDRISKIKVKLENIPAVLPPGRYYRE